MPHFNTYKAKDLRRRDDAISGSTCGDDEDMEDLKRKVLLGSGSVRLATPESGDKQHRECRRADASRVLKGIKASELPEISGGGTS